MYFVAKFRFDTAENEPQATGPGKAGVDFGRRRRRLLYRRLRQLHHQDSGLILRTQIGAD